MICLLNSTGITGLSFILTGLEGQRTGIEGPKTRRTKDWDRRT